MIKNKKIIVTGGAGFIGSHLVDRLVENNNEVTIIDNQSSDSNDIYYWNGKAKQCTADICNYNAIRPYFDNIDYVFHLAAEARIQPTLDNPILAAMSNTVGTCTILQCAKEAGVKRVMYSSTSSAYGLKNKAPLNEEMPNDCLNPYSVTKTAGEELCKMYTNLFDLETVVFRYFNVYGDRQPLKGQYAPVVGIFLRQYKNNEPMTIVGDGEQRRDFTHVDDIVEANLRAATYENVVGETINVGTGVNHSVLEIAKKIGGEYKHLEPRKGEARVTLADTNKISSLLKFIPENRLFRYLDEQGI